MKTAAPYIISEPRSYTINDRPVDKMPIRRLQVEGPEVISTNDLLQISLGKVDGFDDLLHEYGIQFLTTLHTVSDIVESLKIDHLQATRLLAVLALGRRLFEQPQGSLVQVQGVEDIYKHYRSMSTLAKEQVRAVLINSRYQIVHEEVLAIGSIDLIHLQARDIFQAAVERRITALILIHNHPSGDPTPSEADFIFTDRIKEAGHILGIELLDHVIIGRDSYQSCMR